MLKMFIIIFNKYFIFMLGIRNILLYNLKEFSDGRFKPKPISV